MSEVIGNISSMEDAATLIIAGKTVKLFGVEGRGSDYTQILQGYLNRYNGSVRCIPKRDKYSCVTGPKDYDVGKAAIFFGCAHASHDAPKDYHDAEMQAQLSRNNCGRR
jgi:hypothetical protein